MKTERALLISKLLMIGGALLFLLGLVGELLGWWNDVGELLMQVGTGGGAIGGLAALVIGSSSEEVQEVHEAVEDNGRTLDSVDDKLDSVDGKLDKLDSVDGKLDKLNELDVIQAELDAQTGALDRQIRVLGEIRDRL